jgi:hypothetical protein
MKFKIFITLIFLALLFSESAHSQPLPPPSSVVENNKLLHSAVSHYISLHTNGVKIGNKVNKIAMNCYQFIQSKMSLCENTCESRIFIELKKTSLGCMKAFMGFQIPLRRAIISNVEFKNTLTSGLYDSLPEFKSKMTEASDSFNLQYKKLSEATTKLSSEYSAIYQNLLKAQFQQALKDGQPSKNIVGICAHLKKEYGILNVKYYLSQFNNSLIFWSKFQDKVKGYSILANSLRPYCPNDLSPAQYDDLLKLVSKRTLSLSNSTEVQKICHGPVSKEYFAEYCKGTFALDPYAISVLSGGK